MIDLKEIKKNDKLIYKHLDAYRLGLLTETDNKYPVKSQKYLVFNIGRLAKIRKEAV